MDSTNRASCCRSERMSVEKRIIRRILPNKILRHVALRSAGERYENLRGLRRKRSMRRKPILPIASWYVSSLSSLSSHLTKNRRCAIAAPRLASIVWHVYKLAALQQTSEASDSSQLWQCIRQRDESAFAALVRRHGHRQTAADRIAVVCKAVFSSAFLGYSRNKCEPFASLLRQHNVVRYLCTCGSYTQMDN
jgi:hypothetical protein